MGKCDVARDLDRIIRRALEEAAVRCEPGSADEAWRALSQRLRSDGVTRRRLRIGWSAGVAAAVLLLVAFVGPMTVRGWDPWQSVIRMFVGPGDTGLVQFGAGPRDMIAQKGSPSGTEESANERTAGHVGEGAGILPPPSAPSDEYAKVSPDRLVMSDARLRAGPAVGGAGMEGVGGTGAAYQGATAPPGAGGLETKGAGAAIQHGTGIPGEGDTGGQDVSPEGKDGVSIASVPDEKAPLPNGKALAPEKARAIEGATPDGKAAGTNGAPSGTQELTDAASSPQEMDLEAAAKRAPFEVSFPSWLPANTVVLRVTYQSLGPSGEVEIHFGGPQGKDLWLSQRGPVKQYGSGTGFDRTKTRVRTVDILGSKGVLLDFSQDGSSLLEWFGGGVCYRMRSDWDGDVTLQIAKSLKPVPR